ncbi:uncharacterized protein SPPG_00240 [Spizellomyces punctatus DAOM BR117]|uniref:Thioredoxin domain-containing protein n=1 Tax=Spizellomyces punctatus (strain DAOM BR117) TaxID=645134 RepID=A0A0L0HTU1_SPIPD|nr:uncharacterized protein SPPG_00240 [Spizellomyces punctatus DAOM BR117]KND04512.1 hypothetical protein SPPG_00240 [Spizellomyces punctatus DAOM BR117]|eukprot:XP_016612551.1 hypothetical protein SPPG_00240 [Spizellomyces punctatus DAOM BR117]
MKWLLLCFLVLIATAQAHKNHKSRVVELTDANLDELVSNGRWVVEFYANWCGFCNKFAPEYENLARDVAKELPTVRVGRVDIDQNPAATSRFMVQRLPSLYFVDNQQVRSMEVTRQASSILEYLKEEKWQAEKPWNQWLSPFSIGMKLLGAVGSFGQKIVSLTSHFKDTVPAWGFVAIGAGVLLVLAVLGRVLAPAQPSPIQPLKEAKKTQ